MHRLEEIAFFRELSKEHIDLLYDKVFIKSYEANSIVFYEGDESNYLYILLEGSVKMYKTTPKGNRIHINQLHAPTLIGEYACFEQQPYPATCEFVTDGTVGLLPFDTVYELLSSKSFALELIRSLTAKVIILSALVHNETVLSSEAKVADIIIKKPAIFERLKNSEIASILNLTPETFSRIIAKFKREKIIEIKKHKLNILDMDKLFRLIETNKIKECNNCILAFKREHGLE